LSSKTVTGNDALVLYGLMRSRFSCRGYLPETVPHDVIEHMLEMAQQSPSWCNSQPWQVIVTEKLATERIRRALLDYASDDSGTISGNSMQPDFAFPAAYTGIYKQRQREVGWQLYGSVGVTRGDRVGSTRQALENFRLFGAPHMLLITSERELGIYGALDCGVYIGNLMLAAESLGLGMISQAALAGCAPLLRQHFGIPENRMVVLGASFGYADLTHPANSFRSRRADIKDAVTFFSE
jgi:nitroreductase